MAEEWGPWIEHDGKGCPCVGAFVRSETRNGLVMDHLAGCGGVNPDGPLSAWVWDDGKTPYVWPDGCFAPVDPRWQIIRYRIRKPRGLTILEEILADLPEKVDA